MSIHTYRSASITFTDARGESVTLPLGGDVQIIEPLRVVDVTDGGAHECRDVVIAGWPPTTFTADVRWHVDGSPPPGGNARQRRKRARWCGRWMRGAFGRQP